METIPAVLILTVFILSEEMGEVKFMIDGTKFNDIHSTEGRASNVYPLDGEIIVSDYREWAVKGQPDR
jgi:hypothetical protein